MVKTIVHVHRQRIAQNIKAAPEERQPPIIIRQGKQVRYVNEFTFQGNLRAVYSPDKPLPCGARVWFELDMPKFSETGVL